MKPTILWKQWPSKAAHFLRNPPLFYKIGVVLFVIGCFLPLRVTLTQSVEPRLFYLVKTDVFKKGHYVVFKRKALRVCLRFPFIKETIKQVAGIAGDVISVKNNEFLSMNNPLEKQKQRTKDGKILVEIAPGIIPARQLFLADTRKLL